jgi:hypothetical protein
MIESLKKILPAEPFADSRPSFRGTGGDAYDTFRSASAPCTSPSPIRLRVLCYPSVYDFLQRASSSRLILKDCAAGPAPRARRTANREPRTPKRQTVYHPP